jgi:nucleoside-diphosphate-sugar epimerase
VYHERRSNFLGTQALLQLCSEMSGLRSFVHVSTYWVNNFYPYNTPVKEEVHYPRLQLAGGVGQPLLAGSSAGCVCQQH